MDLRYYPMDTQICEIKFESCKSIVFLEEKTRIQILICIVRNKDRYYLCWRGICQRACNFWFLQEEATKIVDSVTLPRVFHGFLITFSGSWSTSGCALVMHSFSCHLFLLIRMPYMHKDVSFRFFFTEIEYILTYDADNGRD